MDRYWEKRYDCRSARDKERKSEIALHIQSSWRIINKKKEEIVMASSDMYSPRTDMVYMEDFDWELQGNNLFDEKSQNWSKSYLIYSRGEDSYR